MIILDESENFQLGHEWEDVILVDKKSGEKFIVGSHYGDPSCGLIGPDEDWFISAGEGIILYRFKDGIKEFLKSGFVNSDKGDGPAFIHAIRLKSNHEVEILLDPWSEYASVWILTVDTMALSKVKEGPFKINEKYTDQIEW